MRRRDIARLLLIAVLVASPLSSGAAQRNARGGTKPNVVLILMDDIGYGDIGSYALIAPGSEAEFITEHYWGYTRQRDGGTVEYRVTHPRWRTWDVSRATLTGDLERLYGPMFGAVLSRAPRSAFLAEGSPIVVHTPVRIPT
jgi:hypothetical protein